MVRMRCPDDEGGILRDRICELLVNSRTSAEDDLQALNQCASQIRNTAIVKALAKESGFKLCNGRTNDHLELYYDIKQGRHDLGYVCKGWNDPGFRIGDLVVIPQTKAAIFKLHAYQLLKFCATNGIVMTVEENSDSIRIALDAVIYSEGFNRVTFRKALDTLNDCVEKAEEVMGKAGS